MFVDSCDYQNEIGHSLSRQTIFVLITLTYTYQEIETTE